MTLYDNARPDEQFHLQNSRPAIISHVYCWPIRWTIWKTDLGRFTSIWLFNHLQIYYGDSKCDGSRTYWAWQIHLTTPEQYVMTTTKKELFAFRWRRHGPGETSWDNMGGS